MCNHKNNEIISLENLVNDQFVIPTYQRGYRWTRSQVEDLLNDLKEFEDNNTKSDTDYYCLQPLVVKEYNGIYRLIDGQQRLTTIWLLLFLKRQKKFRLKYERSDELDIIEKFFLDEQFADYKLTKENINSKAIDKWNEYVERQWRKLCETNKKPNVEVFHIFISWLFIANWLKDNTLSDSFVKNVKVIWHLVEDDIETFQNLNSGKIPLTNAELIKALLLSTYGHRNAENQLRQKLIAEEFDSIERRLRAKDFWYFLNGSGPQPTSCIAFIFELLQEIKSTEAYSGQQLRTYFYFKEIINSLDAANKVWERVTDIFHVLEGWYNTPEIYNLVGFLRAKNRSIKAIYEAYLKCSTVEEFKNHLIYRCLESINWYDEKLANERTANFDNYLKENFRYDNNYERAWNLLLLINISTLNMVKTEGLNHVRKISKFSFADFHNCKWQIEHISPRQAKMPENLSIQQIENIPLVGTKVAEIPDMELKRKIDPYLAALDDSIMCLSNLTFLSNHINASIGNDLFEEKRDMVLQKQSEGFYLLPSSMMVFTKAYTERNGLAKGATEGKTNFWSDIDREAYLGKIKEILSDQYFEQAEKIDTEREMQCIESFTPAFSYTSSSEKITNDSKEEYKAFEQFTYAKLTKEYDYIIIPKIQRDYAQGRHVDSDARAAKIRHNLIKDIFDMGIKGIDFQIIFGTQEERQEIDSANIIKKKVFVPIDGQQRLTTLFLLDLYNHKTITSNSDTVRICKPVFIYETRRSASDFCVDVVNNKWWRFPEISPREAITKSTWFQYYWLEDPTVDGMLVMLDAIHAEANRKQSYPNIDNIHFSFFNLGQESISDTIYLKMNTRGKELTSFENFKAAIEREFNDLSQEWKTNIDGKWLNAFWKSQHPTELPDMRIMRFIANVLFVKICDYEVLNSNTSLEDSIKNNMPKKGEDDYEAKERIYNRLLATGALLKLSDKKQPEYIDSRLFILALKVVEQNGNFAYLSGMLDCFAKSYDFKPYWNSEVSQILDSNYTQRAVLYAVSLFLKYSVNDKEGYEEWMRFVWNIAEHDSTDYKEFIRTCRLFDKLAGMGGCKNILQILQKNDVVSLSNTHQFKEELKKASVSDNPELFELIKRAESHAFFHGTIRFMYENKSAEWGDFADKVANLEMLINPNKEKRKTISLFIPYVPDNDLKDIFSNSNLSNDSKNLMSIFLSEKGRTYLSDFFLRKQTGTLSSLQKQLVALAPIHPDFLIMNNRGTHKCSLTDYKRQSKYYAVSSFPLDDAIYYNVQDILREEPFRPQIGDRFQMALKKGYLVGLEMDFEYNRFRFRYYNEDHTIRLMGSEWGQKLYAGEEPYAFCCVSSETKESLIEKLDAIVQYSIKCRFEYLKKVEDYFRKLGCIPVLFGCNSEYDTNKLCDLCMEELNRYNKVIIEVQLEKYAIAFTIDRNHRIEIGLRKISMDGQNDNKIELKEPQSHNPYSQKNEGWYYVYTHNHFEMSIMQEELNCLINQYKPKLEA